MDIASTTLSVSLPLNLQHGLSVSLSYLVKLYKELDKNCEHQQSNTWFFVHYAITSMYMYYKIWLKRGKKCKIWTQSTLYYVHSMYMLQIPSKWKPLLYSIDSILHLQFHMYKYRFTDVQSSLPSNWHFGFFLVLSLSSYIKDVQCSRSL